MAVVAGALIRLEGGEPTLGDGFAAAFDRLPAIIGYAAIAATVGMVLRYISERTGFIGRLVLGGLGVAWSLATFLVAPVLVVEGVGPIQAITRSASLLRTTWGEQVAGNVGISLVFGLAGVAVMVLAGVPVRARGRGEHARSRSLVVAAAPWSPSPRSRSWARPSRPCSRPACTATPSPAMAARCSPRARSSRSATFGPGAG